VSRWEVDAAPRRPDPPKRGWIRPVLLVGAGVGIAYYLLSASPVTSDSRRRREMMSGGGGGPDVAPPTVRVLSGDAVSVDGVPSTIDAIRTIAARTGVAIVRASDDARHGFVSQVIDAIHSTGASVVVPDGLVDPAVVPT